LFVDWAECGAAHNNNNDTGYNDNSDNHCPDDNHYDDYDHGCGGAVGGGEWDGCGGV
jgi:hypothetical protein